MISSEEDITNVSVHSVGCVQILNDYNHTHTTCLNMYTPTVTLTHIHILSYTQSLFQARVHTHTPNHMRMSRSRAHTIIYIYIAIHTTLPTIRSCGRVELGRKMCGPLYYLPVPHPHVSFVQLRSYPM